jgi:hypothetical protein
VRIGRWDGYHLSWPGGEVLMWGTRSAVFTMIGEGPLVDVAAAAASMPAAAGPSVVDKLRRACRGLLGL